MAGVNQSRDGLAWGAVACNSCRMRYFGTIGRWSALALLLAPASAWSWNPYPDAGNPPPEERAIARPVPSSTVQPLGMARMAPAPMVYTPPPMPVYAPPARAYVPPPAVAAAPVYTPPPLPVYAPPPVVAPAVAPAPAYAPPAPYGAPVAPTYGMAEAPLAASAPEQIWRLGMEAFYDHYREPDADVTTDAKYLALTAAYDYYAAGRGKGWYTGAELRAAFGESEYEGSGTLKSVPEQEYEARWKLGYSYASNGAQWVPYGGLGARYYRDDLKGEVTSTGQQGYDRNILQFYLPVGVDIRSRYRDWDITTNLEYDQLLAGWVSSRLGTIPGYDNMTNHQDSGYGLRASVMFAQDAGNGMGYEFGPFIRWWDIDDSDVNEQAAGAFLEPQNTRLQAGAALKLRF